jgi:hypothetical protein
MKVVSKVDSPFEYEKSGEIIKYGLTKNKVYQVSDVNQSAPNSHEFIYLIQIDGKIIPHLPESFYSIEEWREKQIKEILK